MNAMPFFTIVVPTYNRAHFILRAIESVKKQNFQDWELLIVDDGSTDNTKEVVQTELADQRIKYIYQTNAKESAARNHGMRLAKGKFICLLDSDDIYHDNHLTVLHQRITQENECVGFYHTFSWIDKNGQKTAREIVTESSENGPWAVIQNQVLVNNVCLARAICERMQFREDLYVNEDKEFFLRISADYPVFIIPEYTTTVFIHGGNTDDTYNRASSYYSNRVNCLETLANNEKLTAKLPENYFHPELARYYRWQAQALLRENKKKEARKSMLKAMQLHHEEKRQWSNWKLVIKSFIS